MKDEPKAELARTTISMPSKLYDKASSRQKSLRYKKFTHYIQALIEADLDSGGSHVRAVEKPNSTTDSIRLKIPGKRSRPDL